MERREAPGSLAIGRPARRASGTQGLRAVGVPGRAGPCEEPRRLPALHRGTHCRRPHPAPSANVAIDDAHDRARRTDHRPGLAHVKLNARSFNKPSTRHGGRARMGRIARPVAWPVACFLPVLPLGPRQPPARRPRCRCSQIRDLVTYNVICYIRRDDCWLPGCRNRSDLGRPAQPTTPVRHSGCSASQTASPK